MKRYEIKKDARNFGSKADWYNHKNLSAVNAANPLHPVGGKMWPAAYFVVVVETVYDPMRDYSPCYDVREAIAGPFATETTATEWAEMHAA